MNICKRAIFTISKLIIYSNGKVVCCCFFHQEQNYFKCVKILVSSCNSISLNYCSSQIKTALFNFN